MSDLHSNQVSTEISMENSRTAKQSKIQDTIDKTVINYDRVALLSIQVNTQISMEKTTTRKWTTIGLPQITQYLIITDI